MFQTLLFNFWTREYTFFRRSLWVFRFIHKGSTDTKEYEPIYLCCIHRTVMINSYFMLTQPIYLTEDWTNNACFF